MLDATGRLQVLLPSRGKRAALTNPNNAEFQAKIEEAHTKLSQRLSRDAGSRGLLLLLLDSEDDPACQLAPSLLAAAKQVCNDVEIACVLAVRMLENWIMAGASTLGAVNGLPDPIPERDRFDERSGAAWLDNQLRMCNRRRKYKKTADAEEFVRFMNLQECRTNAPSFDKLCRELAKLMPRADSTT